MGFQNRRTTWCAARARIGNSNTGDDLSLSAVSTQMGSGTPVRGRPRLASISNTIADRSMAGRRLWEPLPIPRVQWCREPASRCANVSDRKDAQCAKPMLPGNSAVGRARWRLCSSSVHRRVQDRFARYSPFSARDRAVLSATLAVGTSTEAVAVTAASPVLETEMAMVAAPAQAAVAGGVIGGVSQSAVSLEGR